jgi:peptidyl-prolyl cis-trans isomerase C
MVARALVKSAAALLVLITGAACDTPSRADVAPAADEPGAAAAPVAAVPHELPAILARVNGEAIERWEVEAALREITLMNLHPIPQAERDELVRTLLDRIIGHHLAAQLARARSLGVSDAEVDADLAAMRREFSSDRTFNETLASFRLSRDQLRQQRRVSLQVANLVRVAIAPTVSVSRAEVEAYYRENADRFQLPEAVRASHILIRVNAEATPEQRGDASRKAADLVDQIRRGADFARLAREHSEDASTARDGGALGHVPRGQMDPAFEAAAFALKPGGLSDVVETPFGFHVIRVEERREARMPALDEVRADITALLTERVEQDKLAGLVAAAREGARIEIYI